MGKGDTRRPSAVPRQQYEDNYARIFGGQQQRGEGRDAIERDAVNRPPAEDASAWALPGCVEVGETERGSASVPAPETPRGAE